jgi:hypothetical protein
MTTPNASIDLPSDDPRHRLSDVVAYQHGELTAEARAAFEAHLLACPGCQKSAKLAAWAFPALGDAILQQLPTPEAQVARLLDPEAKGEPKEAPKRGIWAAFRLRPVLWLIPLAAAGMVLLWVGPRFITLPSDMEAAPTPPSVPALGVRVTEAHGTSIVLELAEDPKDAFVVVYSKTSDGSVQRLKPRERNGRSLALDLQPGSEWLLVLLGQGPQEPGELDHIVMSVVLRDPGIHPFPRLPGVAKAARVPVPAGAH